MTARTVYRTCVFVVMTAILVSCRSGTATVSTDNVASTTLPPVTTTVASAPGVAEAAWGEFVKSFATIDVSQVSNGPCGPRGVIITEGSVTTYLWDGTKWNDDTSILEGTKGAKPSKVYTHDFTNDGVDDFLVVFDDNVRRTGNQYVSIIGYPWSTTEQCKWRWLDIDNGLDTNQRYEISRVDTRTWLIWGTGYVHRRLTGGYLAYLPASSTFIFQPAQKKK